MNASSDNNQFTADESIKIIQDWKNNAELRAEFQNNFDSYVTYHRAVKACAIREIEKN